jgi:hypothetical protein
MCIVDLLEPVNVAQDRGKGGGGFFLLPGQLPEGAPPEPALQMLQHPVDAASVGEQCQGIGQGEALDLLVQGVSVADKRKGDQENRKIDERQPRARIPTSGPPARSQEPQVPDVKYRTTTVARKSSATTVPCLPP